MSKAPAAPEMLEIKMMTLVTGILAAVFTYLNDPNELWYAPLIGALIGLAGLYLKKRYLNNLGTIITAGAFYYVNRFIDYSNLNLVVLFGFFFLFYANWNLNNKEVLIHLIEDETAGDDKNEMLDEFKRSSNKTLAIYLMAALAVSTAGGILAPYSYLDIPLDPNSAIPVSIIFGVIVMAVAYVIIELLPRLYAEEDIED